MYRLKVKGATFVCMEIITGRFACSSGARLPLILPHRPEPTSRLSVTSWQRIETSPVCARRHQGHLTPHSFRDDIIVRRGNRYARHIIARSIGRPSDMWRIRRRVGVCESRGNPLCEFIAIAISFVAISRGHGDISVVGCRILAQHSNTDGV